MMRASQRRAPKRYQAGAETVDGGREVEVAAHLLLRVADVEAVHDGDEIAEGEQGHKAPGGFTEGAGGGGVGKRVRWLEMLGQEG
jgi:hypothetical protein